jgi:hypothetical protein
MLQLQAEHSTPAGFTFGFRRLLFILDTVFSVLAEAEHQARVAHERYPFHVW